MCVLTRHTFCESLVTVGVTTTTYRYKMYLWGVTWGVSLGRHLGTVVYYDFWNYFSNLAPYKFPAALMYYFLKINCIFGKKNL